MNNPYRKTEGQRHHIDLTEIENLCFELVNIFSASKAIAQGCYELHIENIDDEKDPEFRKEAYLSLVLHYKCSFQQISRALLRLCLLIRTYDDHMKSSANAEEYNKYVSKIDHSNSSGYHDGGMDFTIRVACNSVIHSEIIIPQVDVVEHLVDPMNNKRAEQDVYFLTGEIDLQGKFRNKAWAARLYIESFIENIIELIKFGTE